MKKNIVWIFLSVVMACSLSSCNTVQGFGQDLQSGGKSLSRAAQNANNG